MAGVLLRLAGVNLRGCARLSVRRLAYGRMPPRQLHARGCGRRLADLFRGRQVNSDTFFDNTFILIIGAQFALSLA